LKEESDGLVENIFILSHKKGSPISELPFTCLYSVV